MNKDLKKLHYGWIILGMSVLVVLGALGFGRYGYTILFPAMKSGLALTEVQAADLASANMLGYLILALFGGFLASRFGPKLIITVSLAVGVLSLIMTGLSKDYTMAFIGRLLTGMSSGGANVPVMGLMAAWFSQNRRGMASGITVSGSSVGLLLTGSLLPSIIESSPDMGWRTAWIYLAIAVFVIFIIAIIVLRDNPMKSGLYPIGMTSEEDKKSHRDRHKQPIQWSRILKNPAMWYMAGVYTLFGAAYITYTTFFIRYLTSEGGFTVKSAGVLWAFIGGASIASGLIWGGLSDKIGRKYALSIVFILQFFSFTLFGLWKDMPGYIVSSALFALTAWSIPAIMSAAAGDIVGSRLGPAALGFITFFFGIGQVLGPMAAGRICQLTGSYSYAFIMAGLLAFFGSILSLFLQKSSKTPVKTIEEEGSE